MTELTTKEFENLSDFMLEHADCGGLTDIHFSKNCGLGQKVIVECKGCKEKKDITDYESW